MELLERFESNEAVKSALEAAVAAEGRLAVSGPNGVAALLFCLALAEKGGGPLLTVLPDDDAVNLFEREMIWLLEQTGLSGNWELLSFPDYDVLEIDKSPHGLRQRRKKRLKVLSALYMAPAHGKKWILTTPEAGERKTMDARRFGEMTLTLAEGDRKSMAQIVDSLLASGYRRKRAVEHEGDFSIRGGVIDLFPAQSDFPFRIDLAGNAIEEIRVYNVETQRSSALAPSILACPCSEAPVAGAPAGMEQMRADHRALVERGIHFDGAILYPDSFGCDANPLRDGLFARRLIVGERRCEEERKRRTEAAAGWLRKNGFERPEELYERLYIEPGSCDAVPTVTIGPTAGAGDDRVVSVPVSQLPPLPLSLSEVAERIRRETARGAVFVISRYKQRLERYIEDENIGPVRTLEGDLRGGFSLAGEMFVFTDSEMFRTPPPQKKAAERQRPKDRAPIYAPEDIKEGDYVVHVDHGIGLYDGIVKQQLSDGCHKDFFRIKYARGDVLFVPVEQIGRIEKYLGGESALPRVYPLHSGRWEAVKRKVRKKVEELAAQLYRLYSEREHLRGISFSGDNLFMRELAASFPYDETPDQRDAIEEVAADMERHVPMDRLVYGDVGYGKTEVAVRAAFKAVLDKKQVAVLAPTTILAHQHVETFRERLARFPVSVDVISRFRTNREQKETLKQLAAGDLDIIIGTHRLLSKDVVFKDLGLLIIDEEQRFGVKHKETLKMVKKNVDVLTMTATPIPRTLNMSMIGLRNMSVIETPPEDRKAVITFVEEWNSSTLYAAVERELARKGQVYFVHNDIATIDKVKGFLETAFPGARIAVCHGKMPERQIESTMIDFYNNNYDILVSTTIIENGLDIPNVNTLVVNASENFGLSQLYQLRGRVGRSYRQSYAYFFHSPVDFMSEKARARLEAIRDFAELGSGFKLAMKDLELRGAGTLLGREQHGYITEVGFSLYCQMLSESVGKMMGTPVRQRSQVEVELNVDSFIPEEYIEDPAKRTMFYKRVSGCAESEKVDTVFEEIEDRYGPAPGPVKNFIAQAKIRLLAPAIGIDKIKTHPHSGLTDITFRSETAFRRFREAPYPRDMKIEVVYLKDRVRFMHENMKPVHAVREIANFIEFVKLIYEQDKVEISDG